MRARPAEASLEAMASADELLVLRTAGFPILRGFVEALGRVNAGARLTVVSAAGDGDAVRRICPTGMELLEYPGATNLTWTAVRELAPSLSDRRFGAYVFLANNRSAAGYENAIEVLSQLTTGDFFGYTCEGRLLRFNTGREASRAAHAGLVRELSSWFWHQLPESDRL